MNTRSTLLAAGLAAVLVAGCATTRSPGNQTTDAGLTSTVKAKIVADPDLNPFEIHVSTKDRVVHLTGTVEDSADREEAEALARATKGVMAVRNDIAIGDPTFAENVTDAWILAKIKSKLVADPEVNPFNINVDVSQGRVTLSGTVEHAAARTEAERHARETKGVKELRNLIEVKTS